MWYVGDLDMITSFACTIWALSCCLLVHTSMALSKHTLSLNRIEAFQERKLAEHNYELASLANNVWVSLGA